MSSALISRSADLKRLRDEGYAVAIVDDQNVVDDLPFHGPDSAGQRGRLISSLALAGDITVNPVQDHVAHFVGGLPHDAAGQPLQRIIHQPSPTELSTQLRSDVSFSSKPPEGYGNYHEKITTYVRILESEAQVVDDHVTARTFRPVESDDDSPFLFLDTASSRAGITADSAKLAVGPVAIVGLGGTGSYLLDLLAKTLVTELHLFDGDLYLQHNAFRAPGSTSRQDLETPRTKAEYWAEIYGRMRRGVVAHPYPVDDERVGELSGMHTVFLALDDGEAKRTIVDFLDASDSIYVDVGMGLYRGESGLAGSLRVTTSTPQNRGVRRHIPMDAVSGDDPYSTNIQTAELNALNATLAVVRWKKLMGFYVDLADERQAIYAIDGNRLLNEDAA
jgi:hypothetical protein